VEDFENGRAKNGDDMTNAFLFLIAILALGSRAEGDPCYALHLHRSTAVHLTLPSAPSQLLLTKSTTWSLTVWVKFLEGRPGAVVSPILHLVDTSLGMRLRACANTNSGVIFLFLSCFPLSHQYVYLCK
jgi:hypothetical protein